MKKTLACRQDYTDLGQRTRQLAQLAQQLMQLAGTHGLAVRLAGAACLPCALLAGSARPALTGKVWQCAVWRVGGC